MFELPVNIAGNRQRSFSAGGQFTSRLAPGVYDVWAATDIYIKVDPTNAADVTSGTGYLIKAGNVVPVRIVQDSFLGAAGTGTVYFHKVG